VLDVGGGDGAFIHVLLKYLNTDIKKKMYLINLDVDIRALKFAQRLLQKHDKKDFGHLDFICADAQNIPLRSKSINVITALEVIEHVKEDFRCLKQMISILKTPGFILITTPRFLGELRSFSHIREYRYKDLLRLLDKVSQGSSIRYHVFTYQIPLSYAKYYGENYILRMTHILTKLMIVVFQRMTGTNILSRLLKKVILYILKILHIINELSLSTLLVSEPIGIRFLVLLNT